MSSSNIIEPSTEIRLGVSGQREIKETMVWNFSDTMDTLCVRSFTIMNFMKKYQQFVWKYVNVWSFLSVELQIRANLGKQHSETKPAEEERLLPLQLSQQGL